MIISLLLTNFRNYETREFTFTPGSNMLIGQNGIGKTNALEAIYATLRGRSWRRKDETLIREGEQWARVEIIDDEDNSFVLLLDQRDGRLKKTRQINKTNRKSGFPSVVLFEPDFIRTLSGSPDRRRLWIDEILVQINPQYGNALKQFNRSLRQRNMLLKQRQIAPDHLFVWNLKLAEFGAIVSSGRKLFIETHQKAFTDLYKTIADSKDEVSIGYSQQFSSDYSQRYLDRLAEDEQRDRLLGFTSAGPHREDLLITYNDTPSTERMSRGETRTAAIALKQIEFNALQQHTGKPPLLLLDDILSELDDTRSERIGLLNKEQIIATSTNADSASEGNYIRLR